MLEYNEEVWFLLLDLSLLTVWTLRGCLLFVTFSLPSVLQEWALCLWTFGGAVLVWIMRRFICVQKDDLYVGSIGGSTEHNLQYLLLLWQQYNLLYSCLDCISMNRTLYASLLLSDLQFFDILKWYLLFVMYQLAWWPAPLHVRYTNYLNPGISRGIWNIPLSSYGYQSGL